MCEARAPRQRPRVVLITGEPGSGKTTLGTVLSRALAIPFLARDDVRRGLFFTAGAWTDHPGPVPTPDEAVDTFLRIVEATTSLGVSCIIEYVVRQERPADLHRITAAGDCVVVLTTSRHAEQRLALRHRADRMLNRGPVLDALGYTSIDHHTSDALTRMRAVATGMRTDFDLPVLAVDTDDDYDPTLDTIVAFATTDGPSTP